MGAPFLTQEELAVMRLADAGKPLTTGHDDGVGRGAEALAAYRQRLDVISSLQEKRWISGSRALTDNGREVLRLFGSRA